MENQHSRENVLEILSTGETFVQTGWKTWFANYRTNIWIYRNILSAVREVIQTVEKCDSNQRQMKTCSLFGPYFSVVALPETPPFSWDVISKLCKEMPLQTSIKYSFHCLTPPHEKLDHSLCYELWLCYNFSQFFEVCQQFFNSRLVF